MIGIAGQSVKICADTVVQRDIEDAYLGRAFSVYDMLFNGMYGPGRGAGGVLLPRDGKSYIALAVIGVGYLLARGGLPDDPAHRRPGRRSPPPTQPSLRELCRLSSAG